MKKADENLKVTIINNKIKTKVLTLGKRRVKMAPSAIEPSRNKSSGLAA